MHKRIVLSCILIGLLWAFAGHRQLYALLAADVSWQVSAQQESQAQAGAGADLIRERLSLEYAEKAGRITDLYVKAQTAFYQRRYELAMQHIDQALLITENADLLAFKAVIYFGMGKMPEARDTFILAFELDRNLPLPQVEGLRDWMRRNRLIP